MAGWKQQYLMCPVLHCLMKAFMQKDYIKPATGGSHFIFLSVPGIDTARYLPHIIVSKASNIVLLPGDQLYTIGNGMNSNEQAQKRQKKKHFKTLLAEDCD